MSEAEITSQITDWLSGIPGVWWFKIAARQPGKSGSQKTGLPDLCIESLHWGRVWVEVKTARGTLLASQQREIPLMERAGARVLVVRSLKELVESLQGNG